MKQQPASLQPIDTKVISPLKDRGQTITKLANKQVADDQQKACPTMKPPSVARKELHMDQASEDVQDGEENIDKFGEEDYGDAKEARVSEMYIVRWHCIDGDRDQIWVHLQMVYTLFHFILKTFFD
jgi:hypothetical protein